MEEKYNPEELALEYALKNSRQMQELLSQAYQAGYKRGVSDSAHVVNIDGVEYYDINLPSGTLWSYPVQYWDYNLCLRCATYDEVKDLPLPTKEQWEELSRHCCTMGLKLVAPNGVRLGYSDSNTRRKYTVYTLGENCQKGHNRFWLRSTPNEDHLVDVIEFDLNVNSFQKHFTGFKLPFFLVQNKNNDII